MRLGYPSTEIKPPIINCEPKRFLTRESRYQFALQKSVTPRISETNVTNSILETA